MLLRVHQVRHAGGGAHRLLDNKLRVQDVELLLGDLRHVVQVLLEEKEDVRTHLSPINTLMCLLIDSRKWIMIMNQNKEVTVFTTSDVL